MKLDMIDTVGFHVLIDKETYRDLLEKMIVTQRIDKQTGDIEFEYNNARVNFHSPSWNYKVLFKVTDEYWAYDEKESILIRLPASRIYPLNIQCRKFFMVTIWYPFTLV